MNIFRCVTATESKDDFFWLREIFVDVGCSRPNLAHNLSFSSKTRRGEGDVFVYNTSTMR
jgi:hypothetical protein